LIPRGIFTDEEYPEYCDRYGAIIAREHQECACFRAVGLRLHGDEPFMFHCGFGQQDRHGDHALPAGSGQQETGTAYTLSIWLTPDVRGR